MATHAIGTDVAVRRVKATLRGPVLDLLSQRVPELKRFQQDRAFERTLDDPVLLDRCFKAFRQDRDSFRHVLVGPDRKPVESDDAVLACGRTVAEVVAMIVRSSARRYFRRHLGHRPPPVVRQQAPGFFTRILMAIFGYEPVRPAPPRKRQPSPADELYAAIQEYLLHDWQAILVPAYAEMKPAQVRQLGPRLLDLRDAGALRAALGSAGGAPASATPTARAAASARPEKPELVVSTAGGNVPEAGVALADILSPDGRRLKAEAFSAVLLRPDVRKALPHATQSVYVTSMLRGVGGPAAAALSRDLGLGLDQMAVFLVAAQGALGSEVFGRLFGPDADPRLLARLVDYARQAGLDRNSPLTDCATFVTKVFARFTGAKHGA